MFNGFDFGNVQQALYIMLQGMLGIFLFTGFFYTMIYALGKLFKTKKEK